MAASGLFAKIFGPRRDQHAGVRALWLRIVAVARAPGWYARGQIADCVAGRFDAVTLVLALVLLRLEGDAAMARDAALLTELFVTDMDGQLRESGIGDLVVGKHIGRLMATLGGRLGALRVALAGDDAALAAVIARNVTLNEAAQPDTVAAMVRALARGLDQTDTAALLAGDIALPEALA